MENNDINNDKEKLKILVVEPKKEPYVKEINHTLKEMQKVVGGLIEYIELDNDTDLICNDEGKLEGLELNRIINNDIIAGTFFIARHIESETISLTEEQIEKYKKIFSLNESNVIK